MIKKLRKVGNSNALILDRAILELVGLEEGGEVRLTVHNGSLIITPTKPKPVDKEHFEKCLSRGEEGDIVYLLRCFHLTSASKSEYSKMKNRDSDRYIVCSFINIKDLILTKVKSRIAPFSPSRRNH